MKVIYLVLTLCSTAWGFPYTSESLHNYFADFPMKRMYVDADILNQPDFDPRIINGVEVVPNSIPYQTWHIFRVQAGSGGWLCGGTLISTWFVLTAAHCIAGAGLSEVYLGAHDLSGPEANRLVLTSTRLTIHENYTSSTISNDVGVIELPAEAPINQFINIVRLPRYEQLNELFEAENVRVSGWGLTEGGVSASRSQILIAVNSTVLSNAECRSVFSIFEETEICISGEGGVGACNGDSGGPLIAGDIQIGIVSYGRSGCPQGFPSVFARVTSFLSWIEARTDVHIS